MAHARHCYAKVLQGVNVDITEDSDDYDSDGELPEWTLIAVLYSPLALAEKSVFCPFFFFKSSVENIGNGNL